MAPPAQGLCGWSLAEGSPPLLTGSAAGAGRSPRPVPQAQGQAISAAGAGRHRQAQGQAVNTTGTGRHRQAPRGWGVNRSWPQGSHFTVSALQCSVMRPARAAARACAAAARQACFLGGCPARPGASYRAGHRACCTEQPRASPRCRAAHPPSAQHAVASAAEQWQRQAAAGHPM
jgi:hypothetical protein